jgi:hypothetical protein
MMYSFVAGCRVRSAGHRWLDVKLFSFLGAIFGRRDAILAGGFVLAGKGI